MFGAINLLTLEFKSTAQESDEQMALLDTFGPLARAKLNDCPRDPDIRTFLGAFRRQFDSQFNGGRFGRRELILTEPDIDLMFAAFIDSTIVDKLGEPIEWFKLKPRRLTRDGWRSRPTKLKDAPSRRSSHIRAIRRPTRPSK